MRPPDTPRTNEIDISCYGDDEVASRALGLCRTLERELGQAQADAGRMHADLYGMQDGALLRDLQAANNRLADENANFSQLLHEYMEDCERLNWLAEHTLRAMKDAPDCAIDEFGDAVARRLRAGEEASSAFRAAIDDESAKRPEGPK